MGCHSESFDFWNSRGELLGIIHCALEPTFKRHCPHESGESSRRLQKCWHIENTKIENREELSWQGHHNYIRTIDLIIVFIVRRLNFFEPLFHQLRTDWTSIYVYKQIDVHQLFHFLFPDTRVSPSISKKKIRRSGGITYSEKNISWIMNAVQCHN